MTIGNGSVRAEPNRTEPLAIAKLSTTKRHRKRDDCSLCRCEKAQRFSLLPKVRGEQSRAEKEKEKEKEKETISEIHPLGQEDILSFFTGYQYPPYPVDLGFYIWFFFLICLFRVSHSLVRLSLMLVRFCPICVRQLKHSFFPGFLRLLALIAFPHFVL